MGAASGGGASGNGTVFEITPDGFLTTLHSFTGYDGRSPVACLVQCSDGNFYGTTSYGGASSCGTVFRITTSGTLTTIHSFDGTDGANPIAGLVEGTDGGLYGTTNAGGNSSYGTVYRITPAGVLTTIYSFTGPDGAYPLAVLVQGSDGSLYGSTEYGGAGYVDNPFSCAGTVFKVSPAGVLTTLHLFTVSDGANPIGGLVEGGDGNFYGSTSAGGASNLGTVFMITQGGVLSNLHSFTGVDGENPCPSWAAMRVRAAPPCSRTPGSRRGRLPLHSRRTGRTQQENQERPSARQELTRLRQPLPAHTARPHPAP
jgi:uncharacterized repeat protein (TIGR03803 family)